MKTPRLQVTRLKAPQKAWKAGKNNLQLFQDESINK